MRDLVKFLGESLVDSNVSVEEHKKDDVILLKLTVPQNDMGKVIGKKGKCSKAIRNIVKVAVAKVKKRVILDIG
jgi:hypothetical protein